MGRCHSINKVSPKRRWRACASPCVFLSGGGREWGRERRGGGTGLCSEQGLQQRRCVLRCGEVATEDCCALLQETSSRWAGAAAASLPRLAPSPGWLPPQAGSAAMEVAETPAQDRCTRVHDRCLRVLVRLWREFMSSEVDLHPCAVVFWGGNKDVRPFVLLLYLKLKGVSLFFFF